MMSAVSLLLAVFLFISSGPLSLVPPAGPALDAAYEPMLRPSPELTPGEIEDWALGCSAILAIRNGCDPYQFGMLSKSDPNAAGAAALVLSRDWGCDGRAALLDTIARMTGGGHNSDFGVAYDFILSLPEEDYQEVLGKAPDAYMWALTKSLGDKWGGRQIKAWDWFRMIHLAGWGYIAGYLDLREAYDCMTPIIERLRGAFSSWGEANDNYMDGFAWWSLTDVSEPDTEYRLRLGIYEEIKDNRILFNPDVWLSETSSGEKTAFYTDAFRCEDHGDGTYTLIRGVGEQRGALIIPGEIGGLTITAIAERAFSERGGLTGRLVIPDSVTAIGDYAFSDCGGFTGTLTLPASLTSIGKSAFYYGRGLTGDLVLPAGVTGVGQGAFAYCFGLTGHVSVPEGMTAVEADVFSNCGITGVTIPGRVTAIDESAFSGCDGLASIEVSEQNGVFSSIDGVLYSKDQREIILAPKAIRLENLAIPAGVTAIRDWAFFGCKGLTGALTLPGSVTAIGLWAFGECEGLTSIAIPAGMEVIGRESFHGCSGVTGTLEIPGGVTAIEKGAFTGCEGLTGLSIPDSVTAIGDYAFLGCAGLSGVTLPASVQTIGDWAFQGGAGITQAEFLGDAPRHFGSDVFAGCAAGFSIIFDPEKAGWSTPEWNGYPAEPRSPS